MNDNITEIDRQFRVLRQTLFMHSYLRDNYKKKATFLDIVIIISYASMDFEEAKKYTPVIIFPKNNKLG